MNVELRSSWQSNIESVYLNRDVLFEFHLKFWMLPVFVFQLEFYYKIDRPLTGLTAQQKGTTRWYSNKTSQPP